MFSMTNEEASTSAAAVRSRPCVQPEPDSVQSFMFDTIGALIYLISFVLHFWIVAITYVFRGVKTIYYADRPVQIALFITGVLIFISVLLHLYYGGCCRKDQYSEILSFNCMKKR